MQEEYRETRTEESLQSKGAIMNSISTTQNLYSQWAERYWKRNKLNAMCSLFL